ncbi:MAG: hypothetical protein ACRD51_14905 [Candidatus Acidiferrum sp.]
MWDSSQLGLAVANNVVAVALGSPTSKSPTDVRKDGPKWDIWLLVFDAANGKLSSKRGPWSGDEFFELFATARGNMLLLLRHFNQGIGKPGETLLLLSPSGDELKRVALAPSMIRSKPEWNNVLISSGGRTLLVGQTLEDGVHYKLLDADTLGIQSEWTAQAGSNSPWIIALSGKELLGVGASRSPQKPGTGQSGELYVRSFTGTWNPFPVALDASHRGFPLGLNPNQLAFLSDNSIVGINSKRELKESPILMLRTDGSKILSPVIPNLEANTSLTGPVSVSQDGRYFVVGFTHRPWLSHMMLDVWQLDDTFQNDELELILWASSRPIPVAQFNLGSDGDVRAFSLAPDDPPSVVVLGASTLKVIRAHPLR